MIISINRFYPGIKSGGPQTSIYNFCRFTYSNYNIRPTVITLDRDALDFSSYEFLSKNKIYNFYVFDFAKVVYINQSFKFIYPFILFKLLLKSVLLLSVSK